MARIARLIGILGAFVPMSGLALETVDQKIVAGAVEPIAIGASRVIVDAKMDTGADSCSLDARNIESFEKDGVKWVRFEVPARDGRTATLEAPLARTVRIKRGAGSSPPRPVVRLPVCLGNLQREVDVNLVDRERYRQKALVGRNFLAGYVIVDPAHRISLGSKKADCKTTSLQINIIRCFDQTVRKDEFPIVDIQTSRHL